MTGLYLLFMGVYYATYKPVGFCNRCHMIEPYVSSWQASPHGDVHCLHCHEMRGFVGKLESQSRGLNYLYTSITRQYSAPIRGKVFEENCYACHVGDYRQFPQTLRMSNAKANHYELIREGRSCLECHADVGHGLRLTVTPELSGIR